MSEKSLCILTRVRGAEASMFAPYRQSILVCTLEADPFLFFQRIFYSIQSFKIEILLCVIFILSYYCLLLRYHRTTLFLIQFLYLYHLQISLVVHSVQMRKDFIDCKSELISSRLLFISAKRGLLESTQRFTNMSVVLLFTCQVYRLLSCLINSRISFSPKN